MKLDANELIAAACRATGLSDFDGDEWREGLDRLIHGLHTDAHLNDIGYLIAGARITGALSNRLRIIGWHASHPEVAETPVAAPIVILGQPRTGTTILFDLLAQDRSLRAPLTWEVDDPIPPPRTATWETDPRIEAAEVELAKRAATNAEFQAIHPSGPRRGQECVTITAGDFRSLLWPTMFRTASYTKWLLYEADMTSAYRYHRQFLQVLQSEHPGERWLLKTPEHQWHLRELFAAYPDATIIHTHRDPLKVVASVASLMSVLQRIGSDEISLPAIAAEWIDYLIDGNDWSVAARRDGTVPAGQAVDVAFADFMSDSIGTIAAIYDQIGRPFTAETEAAMRTFLADNASDKHGTHTYSFGETGLDLAACRARTAGYEEFFDVPQEVG